MLQLVLISCLASFCWGAMVPKPRIIGGEVVDIESFPYMLDLENYRGLHYGGAALISKKYAITSAYVALISPTGHYIRYGSSKVENGTSIKVKEVIVHPKYNYTTEEYNVAIMKLEKPVKLSSKAQPIPVTESTPCMGQEGVVTGWGLDENMDNHVQLKAVTVPLIPQKTCADSVSPKYQLSPRKFCAGGSGSGNPCGYDNGGPLVIDGQLAGVMSVTPNCYSTPTVYTNLGHYEIRQFIHKHTGL